MFFFYSTEPLMVFNDDTKQHLPINGMEHGNMKCLTLIRHILLFDKNVTSHTHIHILFYLHPSFHCNNDDDRMEKKYQSFELTT